MDTILLLLSFFLVILGIIGSFLPVLPGPLTGWTGLLLLHFTDYVPMDRSFLIITFCFALLIFILDYFIPAIGTKKFGGSKYGVYGTTLGLIVGLLSPIPFGVLIGPFLGAFIGELLYDNKNTTRALKASFGSFIGFLSSIFIKFSVALIYFGLFLRIIWKNKEGIF